MAKIAEFESRQGLFFLRNILNSSGAHPASYSMGKREADHSPPFSSAVKKKWRHTSTPRIYLFIACTGTTLLLTLEVLRMMTKGHRRPADPEGCSESGRGTNAPFEVVKLM
jgi:hypothetical protein